MQLHFRVDDDVAAYLEQLAYRKGQSPTQIAKQIVTEKARERED